MFEESRRTDEIFHGGFGLINYQQIPKAAFHGYRMMNALGDRTIAQTVGGIVTRSMGTGRVVALVYNYPPEVRVSLPVSKTLAEADATGVSCRAFTVSAGSDVGGAVGSVALFTVGFVSGFALIGADSDSGAGAAAAALDRLSWSENMVVGLRKMTSFWAAAKRPRSVE